MRLHPILALLALFILALAPSTRAGCDGLSETRCAAAPDCVWCVAAAVPSACYSKSDAARLPPAVFTCGKQEGKVEMMVS